MPRTVVDRTRPASGETMVRASKRPGDDLVNWVYAISKDFRPSQLDGVRGVGGERVRAVTEAGLTAVVGSVDAETFGDHARATLLSDLASIERIGRSHHEVIACMAFDGPVLPMRLATVYADDATVSALLARRSAEFTAMLESFRGMEEWGVKVYVTPAPGRADGPAPGEAPWRDLESCAEVINEALSGIAVSSQRQPATDPRFASPAGWLMLNGAYLVHSDRAAEFSSLVRALTGREGVRGELTGPWPPYSFAELHEA